MSSSTTATSSTHSTPSTASNVATSSVKKSLELLEEDDEFEEFEVQDWTEGQEAEVDKRAWEDDWDDETLDEFTLSLRTELQASGLIRNQTHE
ncbi:hypothetical protein Pelo_5038 [Pelomyxa schiedti]|nr:hypothetical protein Pelo_5038 [Pelomyxa schiedti]